LKLTCREITALVYQCRLAPCVRCRCSWLLPFQSSKPNTTQMWHVPMRGKIAVNPCVVPHRTSSASKRLAQIPDIACIRAKKEGKPIPEYAQCRNSNHTSSCPCTNPPCIDYTDDYAAKNPIKWSCEVLTGGCSAAYKPCGPGKKLNADAKKTWHGTPCCQWGCTCDYNQSWSATCQPPKGKYACTEDAEKLTRAKQEDSDDDDYDRLFSITDGVPAPHRSLVPRVAGVAGLVGMVSAFAMVLRKWQSQGLQYDRAAIGVEADTVLE